MALASEGQNSNGYVRLFDKYDFNKGNYSIAGILWHDQRHKLQKMIGNFYTDDIEVLNKIKGSWITEKPSPFYACGYHFGVFVIKDGKKIESFFINVEKGCNTVVTQYGQFYFDPTKIQIFKSKFKKPKIKRKRFNSCQEGRNYIKALDKNDRFLMYLKPRWIKYDGEFRFYVSCDQTDYGNPISQQCLDGAESRISKKFPKELFALEQSGSSNGKILITMKCKKALYDKFDIYEIDWKWSDYSPDLKVLFKKR
jgi:hypothetical protein